MRSLIYLTFALLGAGVSAPTLAAPITVYSAQGGDRAIWITEQATQAGHDIEILHAGGGEIFSRLIAERHNPQADVVFGLVDSSMATLSAEGLFQRYRPQWADGLPQPYTDPQEFVWKFWQTPIVLAYNADILSAEDAPKSWLDLIKPEYAGRYAIGSLSAQTTRAYLAGILVRFLDKHGNVSDAGWDFMRTLFANAMDTSKAGGIEKALASGQIVIDLNWFGGAVHYAYQSGYTLKMVDTEGGTPIIAEGIAIMKGTDQREQARAFVDWFGSPAFMAAYAKKFGQTPAHPEAIALSPQKVQDYATRVSAQPIDWNTIAPKIDGWLQTIELEIR